MIHELIIVALEFYRDPYRFPNLLDPGQALPDGISELLATPTTLFSDAQIHETADKLNASVAECREMVPFFIKRVLIDVNGDYYRVLGLRDQADNRRIKQHYHYIIRLFHPDRDTGGESWDDVYVPQINAAYNTLRNPGRRKAYDAGRAGEGHAERAQVDSVPARQRKRSHRGKPARVRTGTGMSAGMKKTVLVVALLSIAGILLMVLSRPNHTALRIEAGKEVRPELRSATEGVERLADRPVPGNSGQDAEFKQILEPASIQGVGVRTKTAGLSIEETIRQRVAQAEQAVSGMPVRGLSDADEEAALASMPEPASVDVAASDDGKQAGRVLSVPVKEKTAPVSVSVPAPVVTATASSEIEQVRDIQGVSMPQPRAPEPPEAVASSVQPALVDVTSVSVNVPKAVPVEAVVVSAGMSDSGSARNRQPLSKQQGRSVEDGAPEQATSLISNDQTLLLLASMMSSYEAGNLQRFTGLFADDAYTSSARGKREIVALYKKQFARPERRRISISRLNWTNVGSKEKVASGVFQLVVTPFDDEIPSTSSISPITLGLKLTPSGLKINSMVYKGIRE